MPGRVYRLYSAAGYGELPAQAYVSRPSNTLGTADVRQQTSPECVSSPFRSVCGFPGLAGGVRSFGSPVFGEQDKTDC